MLRESLAVLKDDDRERLGQVEHMDDTVDRLYEAIKLYLTEVSREPLGEEDSRRCSDIMAFTTNLEHIGDIIDKSLRELAAKKNKYRLHFCDDGFREIGRLHARVQTTPQPATRALPSGCRQQTDRA